MNNSIEALLADKDLSELMGEAAALRDQGFAGIVTYSPKVFLPLTQLCRDVCHYCTFAKTPKKIEQPFMSLEQVLDVCRDGARLGCKEALFTLGEKPELRYKAAREGLDKLGFASTLEYVAYVAKAVFEETGLFPHINAGCMSAQEIALLKPVSASMGIMLESASPRLCEKGMPHYGSPDKQPELRLKTIEEAGKASVPFTTGILIGIGETRRERLEALQAIKSLHERYGHIQEIIIQNFRAKPGTKMAQAPEPELDELLWTIACARLMFGPHMAIQAPPNLSPGVLEQIVAAGINDWGGVSPLTPDYVNPEAPWPEVEKLSRATAVAGKQLQQRLTVYPGYIRAVQDKTQTKQWLEPAIKTRVLQAVDAQGLPLVDSWRSGQKAAVPSAAFVKGVSVDQALKDIVEKASQSRCLSESEIVRLFEASDAEFEYVCTQADALRAELCGEEISFAINRNINYTNVCYFKCRFCAFSKGKLSDNLRGRPYDLDHGEIARRVTEAWQRGATEVCMQGGIHPDYTGQNYLDILHTVKKASPEIHVHAFSPLEITQGAETLGLSIEVFLQALKQAGLGSLPGTAAEILDDEVRDIICPDKINTGQWLKVMETAHRVGLKSTATIMFGHVEGYQHWARHLLAIRQQQESTGGFTEFVPLPFVAEQSPMYLKGQARSGPSFREAVLMHAVARLVLHRHIPNIQTSWVKMGRAGAMACLNAGANDLGGSLMNESITRAAGASHGEEMPAAAMESMIDELGRVPRQRTTLYGSVSAERQQCAREASELAAIHNTPALKYARSKNTPVEDIITASAG